MSLWESTAQHAWHEKDGELPIEDQFIQAAFPVSSELLTAEFVREHVSGAAKQAVLLDLKQPHPELIAVHGV